ncbi:MAG: hypothetical protein NWE89_15620 [Candidatus Bathyarchaeota archaeon]|nr:hypothetical protein [Candidatus Bathyarchaeota archaeon]
MAEKKPIQRDEIIGALTLVIMFAAVLIGREAGNFFASFEEMKNLKVFFEVTEEELSDYLREVLEGESPDLDVSLTITLPSVDNTVKVVTEMPDYVRRWLISVTLSPVIVRQPSVSDVEMTFTVEDHELINETYRFEKDKVPYLGLVDRGIGLEIEDVLGLREIVEEAASSYGGEVKVQVKGRVKTHLWFLDAWLPFSTIRYPLVEAPSLVYESSKWQEFDGSEITVTEMGQSVHIGARFSNPTRVHSIRENVTCSVFMDGVDEPVAVIEKELPLASSSEGSYVFMFTPENEGDYRFWLETQSRIILSLAESPILSVQ